MSVICRKEKSHGMEVWRTYVVIDSKHTLLCEHQCKEIAQTKANHYRKKLEEIKTANSSKNNFYKSIDGSEISIA